LLEGRTNKLRSFLRDVAQLSLLVLKKVRRETTELRESQWHFKTFRIRIVLIGKEHWLIL
jgi:hypothetical protein